MKYWLMKSEPDVWSLEQQKKAGHNGIAWDGVRNFQAANNLKKMKVGDLCFFYHSNIGKEIVGVVKVIKKAFIDKTDKNKRFVAVQVRFEEEFLTPISLGKIKKTKNLSVKIPSGVDSGDQIRLSGEGEAGGPGVQSGDLYVSVRVKQHHIFQKYRHGDCTALVCLK